MGVSGSADDFGVRSAGTVSVGSFDAKTHFADLLRRVEAGETVTITRNGHVVATMQSPAARQNERAVSAWRRLMDTATEITAQNAGLPITAEDITEWKNDGRK